MLSSTLNLVRTAPNRAARSSVARDWRSPQFKAVGRLRAAGLDAGSWRAATAGGDSDFTLVMAGRGAVDVFVSGCGALNLAEHEFALIRSEDRTVTINVDQAATVMQLPKESTRLFREYALVQDVVVGSTTVGPASVVAQLSYTMHSHGPAVHSFPPASFVHHAVGFIALLCSDACRRSQASDNAALVSEAIVLIDMYLSDSELTPTKLGRMLNVSTRTLQRAFAMSGTSVAACIRSRRLERCRMDLESADAYFSISEIGARWGLPDASHFCRLFRNTYGCSPSEFRSLALQAAG